MTIKNNLLTDDGWLKDAEVIVSPHCDDRECGREQSKQEIDLLVIHNISLPPAQQEADFNNDNVEAFFMGCLQPQQHPYFETIADMRVSAHFYIKRDGQLIQFVPVFKRAWHAGVSQFQGREKCNEYSIGIELQGTDQLPYTDAQYQRLTQVTKQLISIFDNLNKERIVGHNDIAPDRKTDPGPSFDWARYKQSL